MSLNLGQIGTFYNASSNRGRIVGASQPYVYNTNLDDFINNNTMTYTHAAVLSWAYLVAVDKILVYALNGVNGGHARFDSGQHPVDFVLNAGTFVIPNLSANQSTNVAASMPVAVWNTLVTLLNKSINHVIELVAANQVKKLSERNFESYYKMCDLEIPVTVPMKIINFLSQLLPRLIADPNVQNSAQTIKWLGYHTSYAGSPALVAKVITETNVIINWQVNTVNAVNAALLTPWDPIACNAIPTMALAITYVYLDAMNNLPDREWFQGSKAVNTLAPLQRAAYKAFFKRFGELKNNTAQIGAINSVPNLANALSLAI